MATVALLGLSPDLERLVEEALHSAGHAVYTFHMHSDVVPVLGKLRLDVLVVDGHPFTNMGAFVRALRDHPATAHLPALLLTVVRRDDVDLGPGSVRQIDMPFDVDQLLSAIAQATAESPAAAKA